MRLGLRDRLATQSKHGWALLSHKQRAIFWVGCLAMLVVPAHGAWASSGGEPPSGKLGFGFFVLAGNDTNSDGLEINNRMWFAIEPGSTGYREFRVSSTSQITQLMTMGLIPAVRENGGNLVAAPELQSDASDWVSFEPSMFDLAPGESKIVKISFAPPAGTDPIFVESFIEVNASKKAAQTAQYVIPTALATNFPVTLTVGNVDQLAINFNILDVEGFLNDAGPQLRVYIKNAGRTPISPAGFVQLSSMDFDSVRSDQLVFAGMSIFPNTTGSIDVPVSDPVVAGKWRVLVSASQGSTRVTEIFEKDLTFDAPPRGINIPFSINTQRISLALLAVMLLVLAKRTGSKTSNGRTVKSKFGALSGNGALRALGDWWKKASAEAIFQNATQIYMEDDALSTGLEPSEESVTEPIVTETALEAIDEAGDFTVAQESENTKYKSVLAVVSKWVKEAQMDNAVALKQEVEQQVADVIPEVVLSHNQGVDELQDLKLQDLKLQSETLRELQRLFTDGIISKAQFDRKRKEILEKM